MDPPVILPSSEHWSLADDAVQSKILESCTILGRVYMEGKPCQWHVGTQNSLHTPYLLSAVDPQSGGVIQNFNLDREGQIESHSAVVPSPTPSVPTPSPQEAIFGSLSDTLVRHGMRLVKLDLSPPSTESSVYSNSEWLSVIVEEVKGNRESVEDDIRRAYLSALPALYGMDGSEESALPGRGTGSFKIHISQEAKPVEETAPSPKPEPKLRSRSSAQSLAGNIRISTSLQKKSSLSSLKGSGAATPPRSPISRRASSNLLANRSTASPKASPAPETPPQKTPASVAKEFFDRDMAQHVENQMDSELVVILHDSCYGHRYSRPKTSKANLSTIVERPERILATVLGVSIAYVLMGGRHLSADYPPHPEQGVGPVPFKIRKSSRFVPLTSPTVTNVHGTKWMTELKMMCEGAEGKLLSTGKELTRPTALPGDNQEEERPMLHEGDLYLCEESLNALEGALGGVLDAVDTVFDVSGPRRAFVGIRPPGHHCSADYPSGFCWLNNVHVGISHAAAVHGMTHAAIIDFDLHHGDGSQAITWAHNAKVASLPRNASYSKRTAIGYFSLHDINSYPCEWGDLDKVSSASLCIEQAHGQTIWNVHLQEWKTNAEFWELYESRYSVLLEKMRAFLRHHTDRLRSSTSAPQPRAAIFISAGFDASEWESQGMQRHKVNVPTDFYARFTKDIMDIANEPGLGADGRIISVLEGGYSDRALTSGVLSHLSGMSYMLGPKDTPPSGDGFAQEMAARLGNMSLDEKEVSSPSRQQPRKQLGPEAWAPSALDEVDAIINPPPPSAPRKPKGPLNPTYTTPTQSFTAKMIPTARRGSAPFHDAAKVSVVPEVIPDVGWATAASELSKILTPDRQVRSCKPEDLTAQATKVRRDRQSVGGMDLDPAPVSDDSQRMQLRGRKAKAPAGDEARPPSRSNRRTTIGGSELSDLLNSQANDPPKAPRRRVSVASTILSTAEEPKESVTTGTRSRRASGASVARPSSAAGKKAETPASKARKSRSPSKPRVQKKVTPGTPVPQVPAEYKRVAGGPSVRPELAIDAITSGVSRMKIKLNLPPKPEQEPQEMRAKGPGRPRKNPAAPKSAKKPASANRLASAASNTSSSVHSEINNTATTPTGTTAASSLLSTSSDAPKSGSVVKSWGEAPALTNAPQRSSSSRASSRLGARSDMSPDGYDSSFDVQPFDAAKASVDAKQQGVSRAMGTMPPPGQSAAPAPPSPLKPETPRAARQQLPTFTPTTPIPFAPLAASPSKKGVLAHGSTNDNIQKRASLGQDMHVKQEEESI